MQVKKIKLNLPLLDSLSSNAQKVYLFLCAAQGKFVSVDAISNILRLPPNVVSECLIELFVKNA